MKFQKTPEEIRKSQENILNFGVTENERAQAMAFSDFIDLAVNQNYLLICAVTSHTQARVKSLNLPFGVGKTTFAIWTKYVVTATRNGTYPNPKTMDIKTMQRLAQRFNPYDLSIPEVQANWDGVFKHMVYNILDCFKMIKPGQPRIDLGIWDDTPATAPAERGVPKAIYRLKGYLTTARPNIACLMMTGSNRNEFVAPLRKLITVEIIIAERGVFEVQKVKFYKNFRNPEIDISRLEYLEEGVFPPLPAQIQKRYDEWREIEKAKIYPNIEKELAKWLRMQETAGTGGQVIEGKVMRTANHYFVQIPNEVGERYHHQTLEVSLPPELGEDDKIEDEETVYTDESQQEEEDE